MDYSHETMGCAPREWPSMMRRSLTGRTVISESDEKGDGGPECRAAAQNSCFRLFIIMCARMRGLLLLLHPFSSCVPPLLVINLVFSLPRAPRGNSFPFPKVLSINRCALRFRGQRRHAASLYECDCCCTFISFHLCCIVPRAHSQSTEFCLI